MLGGFGALSERSESVKRSSLHADTNLASGFSRSLTHPQTVSENVCLLGMFPVPSLTRLNFCPMPSDASSFRRLSNAKVSDSKVHTVNKSARVT
eukprot:5085991-Amphidinium_carterae.1